MIRVSYNPKGKGEGKGLVADYSEIINPES
jgi:hypothetical protein